MFTNCSQWFKDTNLKANHNPNQLEPSRNQIVPNGSKILIWKQITTWYRIVNYRINCSQWFKDTNLKANHNELWRRQCRRTIVPNGSKILIWKQITTITYRKYLLAYCSQWFKDTNLKANHNSIAKDVKDDDIVPNGSKILIWKQITTWHGWLAKII